jgi:dTDP-4-amino-4,6-dideoxygalactose transaminase
MMHVPFVDLKAHYARHRADLDAAVLAVAEEQRFILGPRVDAFERAFARALGVDHAVGVASGTDALALALRALGVGAGDAVVVPSFTFAATAEAVVLAGARPVFADVDAATLTLSPASVEEAVERAAKAGARVRCVVPVHLFGRMADMKGLAELAWPRGLALLEDAAQAAGASRAGVSAGVLGEAAAFSFFPSKNLGAWGDAGAVTTKSADVAARVRSLRGHGVEAGAHARVGTNSRLDALQAAVLSAKLPHLGAWVRARRAAAARYGELLAPLRDRVTLPGDEPGHAYNVYAIRARGRDTLAAALAGAGIETKAYYATPLHRQPAFAPFADAELPATDAAAREVLALPMYPEITAEQQGYVAARVRAALG